MRILWLSSAFRRTALALLAVLLLGIAVVGLVVIPAQAQAAILSQGKPVTCSSIEHAGTPCANAVDGNTGTRWSSASSDPQWIQVDLGNAYLVTSVVLNWETASGKAFRIDISYDATNWTTLYSTTNGTGGTQTITVSRDGRYVRMYGTVRNTQWGYSLWEFQVYGYGSTASDTPPTFVTPTLTTPPPTTNLALNKPVTYSSQQAGNEAVKAVDGSTTTRWAASPWPQWIRVDLGTTYSINRTELMPYQNRAYRYRIEVSTNGTTYTTAVDRTSNTTGGATLADNFAPVPARYVRLTVTGASGYTGGWVSFYEFRVFGSGTPTPPPPVCTPVACPNGTLQCPVGQSCPGGCGYVCVPFTPTPTTPPTTPPPSTLPDLVITRVYPAYAEGIFCDQAQPIVGMKVDFMNTGSADAGSFVVSYRNSNGRTDQQSVSGLAAGQSGTLFFLNGINYMSSAEVTIDSLAQVAEANESNNMASLYIPVSTALPPCPPSLNVALNKPVTSSNQQTGNEAAKAVDGSTTTRWAASPWPQWIRVDLGAVYNISRTEIMPYQSYAYQYRIEVSLDGATYTTVVDKTWNTSGSSTLPDNFGPVLARYVRLVVTGASGYTGGWVSLYEFRIFGGTSTPPPNAPDLTVIGISYAPYTPVPCGTSTPSEGVLVTVRNVGGVNAGPFVVTANTSRTANVPGLAAGAEISIQFTNMGGPVTAVADATNLIAESNETNNQRTVYLPVPTVPPGCTPPPPTFTPTPGPG